jgi:O-antigen/teichoic acid export membrane protein
VTTTAPRLSAPAPAAGLRSGFAWTAAGNAVYSACQWALISVLAKLTDAGEVGRYALALAVVTPVLMLAQLNLRAVLATDVRHQHGFASYRALRLAFLALSMLIMVPLAFSGGSLLLVLLVGAAQSVEAVSDIYYGLLQRHERLREISVSLALRAPLSLAALAAGILLTGRLEVGLAGLAIARLAILLGYDLPATRALRTADRTQASRRECLEIVKISWPLGVTLMLNALATSTPRYFLAGAAGTTALGVFSAVAVLVSAGNLLINALGQAATPRLARLFADGDLGAFTWLSLRLTGFGFALGLAGLLACAIAGRPALALLYRPEYAAHLDILLVSMAAGAIGYAASLLGYAITATRRFTAQVPILVASALAATAASFVFIPRFGAVGAALAVAAGSLAQLAGEAVLLRAALRKGATA